MGAVARWAKTAGVWTLEAGLKMHAIRKTRQRILHGPDCIYLGRTGGRKTGPATSRPFGVPAKQSVCQGAVNPELHRLVIVTHSHDMNIDLLRSTTSTNRRITNQNINPNIQFPSTSNSVPECWARLLLPSSHHLRTCLSIWLLATTRQSCCLRSHRITLRANIGSEKATM